MAYDMSFLGGVGDSGILSAVSGLLKRWKKTWMVSMPTTRPVMKLRYCISVSIRRITRAAMMINVMLS